MKKNLFPILPSTKNVIGILGGGQLGKMTAMAATKLGFKTYLYCPKGDNPAEEVVSKVYHGSWSDLEKIDRFASNVVCATSEFENVPSPVLDRISKITYVFPNAKVFKNAQNRDREKKLATQAGFKLPKWHKVNKFKDFEKYSKELNFHAILKTNSLGYDGKGQGIVNSEKNLQKIWDDINSKDCVLEQKINFNRELSILYAKSADESECFFPISENVHENGILRKTIAPAFVDARTLNKIKKLTKNLAKIINLTGLLTIEMFQLDDENILFNEIAPRPHNSFHWTIEGCKNSQFDILIQSICGHKIKDETSSGLWEMQNILGKEVKILQQLSSDEKINCHIYGKKEIKEGRKMGHYTKKIN